MKLLLELSENLPRGHFWITPASHCTELVRSKNLLDVSHVSYFVIELFPCIHEAPFLLCLDVCC